jgi:hypothetical protein
VDDRWVYIAKPQHVIAEEEDHGATVAQQSRYDIEEVMLFIEWVFCG